MIGGESKGIAGRSPPGVVRALWLCASVWLKTFLGWRTWAWILPVVLLPVGLAAWQVAAGQEPPGRLFEQLFVNLYLQLVALGFPMFLAISAVRDELDDGTAAYVLTRPVRREVVFVGKLAGAFLLAVACMVASLAMTWVVVFIPAGPTTLAEQVQRLPLLVVVLALAAAAYTGVFGLAGMVLPRPFALSIIFALGWEVVCSNLPGGIPRFTLMYYLKSLLGLRPEAGGVLGVLLPPMAPAVHATAVTVLLIVTALAVACCALVAARKEFKL